MILENSMPSAILGVALARNSRRRRSSSPRSSSSRPCRTVHPDRPADPRLSARGDRAAKAYSRRLQECIAGNGSSSFMPLMMPGPPLILRFAEFRRACRKLPWEVVRLTSRRSALTLILPESVNLSNRPWSARKRRIAAERGCSVYPEKHRRLSLLDEIDITRMTPCSVVTSDTIRRPAFRDFGALRFMRPLCFH